MKYGLIFLMFAAALSYLIFQTGNIFLRILVGMCALSFVLVSAAYFLNSPGMFLKASNGKISLAGWGLHWPFFLLNRFSLMFARRTSRGRAFDEIMPGLVLGCLLSAKDRAEIEKCGIRAVVDLTGEFNEVEFFRTSVTYRCIPVLDHSAPTAGQLAEGVAFVQECIKNGPVYVHCALGRGRSATLVGACILSAGLTSTADEAIALIQKKRPDAQPTSDQIEAIKQFNEIRTKA